MKILSMDTSSKICSVAVLEDDKVIDEMHNESKLEHSQTLMPMIKNILKNQNMTLKDINLLSCSIGPGSFTGTRIGIATVKAFSDAKKIPIAGINSLEAQAYSVLRKFGTNDCKILSMIDARNDNAYFAVYRMRKGRFSMYKNPDVMSIFDTIDYVDFKDNLYIIGDIKFSLIDNLLQAKMQEQIGQGADVKKYEYVNTSESLAVEIGMCAMDKYNKGLYGDSMSIHPMYLRKSQAERLKLNIDDSKIYILKPTQNDIQSILQNYDKFSNLWDKETFYQDSQNSEYYVAKQNNEVLGFISIKMVLDEIEIMNIVTREDKRGQGIASDLLSFIIINVKANKIYLEVNAHNKVALNIYKNFGFKDYAVRKNYYNNQTEDAILMSL